MMRSLPVSLISLLAAAVLCAPTPAPAAFGLEDLDAGFATADGGLASEAGTHPHAFATTIDFNTKDGAPLTFEVPDGSPRDLTIAAVPGLAGNPTAVPRCTTLQFLSEECPATAQVGFTDVTFGAPDNTDRVTVYSLTPPPEWRPSSASSSPSCR